MPNIFIFSRSLLSRAAILFILYPYVVGFAPQSQDTSSTEIALALGRGSYADVSRDCSGRVLSVRDVPFQEGGVSITHKVSVFKLGIAGGFTNGDREHILGYGQPAIFLTPRVGLNTKYFGLDLGITKGFNARESQYSFSKLDHFTSGELRLGNLDSWYFSTGVANNLPLLTGGGLVDLGLGFNLGKPYSNLWCGLAAYPYEGAVFSVKTDIPVANNFVLNIRGQIGGGESLEYGLALGGRVIF